MDEQLKYLFSPVSLNTKITLKNRIVMAPMSHFDATKELLPNPAAAAYYTRRAASGLIIAEAVAVSSNGRGYLNVPEITTREQIDAWTNITQAVHMSEGKIFLQLWHAGRVSHPIFLNGEQPVAPSAIKISGCIPRTKLEYEVPRALLTAEIATCVEYFAKAAEGAVVAGFDGVEIHGANGYLVDQFLHHYTNRRQDAYGVTPENMSRFLLEIIAAVSQKISSERVGVRLSPAPYVNGIQPSIEDREVYYFLLQRLSHFDLAYVHLGVANDLQSYKYLDNEMASEFLRKHYKGNLIACGGYTPIEAIKALQQRRCDLVAFGKLFLANPDLVYRISHRQPLVAFSSSMLLR